MRLFALILVLLSQGVAGQSAAAGRPDFQNLGGMPISPDQTLILGGSFGPPTLEHMGLVTRLMERFGFMRAKLWVATPYKKGAAPADVSLGLTRVAVEHADEVLTLQGTPFTLFQSVQGSGISQWVGRGGKTFELRTSDYDIRNQIRENALASVRAIHGESGDARKNFWVSGGDSFAGVQKWTPQWRELFDHTHWIVVSRPGFENLQNAVRFEERDPLARAFDREFLSQYAYFFDQTNRVHVYQNRDPQKPNIYVVDLPSLNDSSSRNRESLHEDPEREHAQAGLQPSVFKECVENGYYADQEGGVFSRTNLETYLRWLFSRVEREHARELTDDERKDFQALSEALIAITEETAMRGKQVPIWRAALAFAVDHAREYWGELKDLRNLSKRVREATRKYGIREFAVIYIALEVAEMTVFPMFMYHLAGPAGALVAPLLHPNEMITIPGYFAWRLWRKRQTQKRLAGSVQQYQRLIELRSRLLRGDPTRNLLRVELPGSLALGGETLTLNLMKSRLPGWIPLAVRRWDDRRVRWYDVNVSTNELAAILGNSAWVSELRKSTQDEAGFFAALSTIAIHQDPVARDTLRYFVTSRYFGTLLRPGMAEEILQGLSPLEQRLVVRLQKAAAFAEQTLGKDGFVQWRETLAALYGLLRINQVTPGVQQTILVGYPDKKAPERLSQEQSLLLARLHIAWGVLAQGGRGPLDLPQPDPRHVKVDVNEELLRNLVRRFVKENQDLLLAADFLDEGESEIADVGLRPALARARLAPAGTTENFTWEITLARTDFLWRWELIEKGMDYGMRYLESRPRAKGVDRLFWKTLERLDRERELLLAQMETFEFEWLQAKYREAAPDAQVPEFNDFRARWSELVSQASELLEHGAQLIRYAEGASALDVQNRQEVRSALEEMTCQRLLVGS